MSNTDTDHQMPAVHGDAHGEEALIAEIEHPEQHSTGMPQLNIDDFAPQLVWLAITFIALYIVMSKIALPRIGQVITERRNKIAEDLDSADRLKKEADDALEAYEDALAEARAKAVEIAAETRDRLARETATEREALEAALETKLAEAEARISATKTEAMSHVQTVAADVAQELVARLTGEANADQINAAVSAALAKEGDAA